MEDFDIPQNKLAESAERVIDRALDEARRRDHALLTNEHVCLGFAQVEWDMFGQVMRDLELNPHEILQALEEHLRLLPSVPGRDLRVAPSTKLLFKLALLHASRSGRHSIEASDLFSAIFEETQGIPVSIIRRHGIEPETLVTRLATRMRDHELREERLKKRFELPPFLKHFATNLNQLARLANQGGRVVGPSREDLRTLLRACEALRNHVRQLVDANLRSWEAGRG